MALRTRDSEDRTQTRFDVRLKAMEDRWDDRLNKMMASWEQNSRGMANQSRGKQVLVEEETSLGRPNLISEEKV